MARNPKHKPNTAAYYNNKRVASGKEVKPRREELLSLISKATTKMKQMEGMIEQQFAIIQNYNERLLALQVALDPFLDEIRPDLFPVTNKCTMCIYIDYDEKGTPTTCTLAKNMMSNCQEFEMREDD